MLLSVAISALIHENKILLIKRIKEPYKDYWGLPGGKIEVQEHLSDAAQREILEETGLATEFINHSATISELLIEDNQITKHFLLHLCQLKPKSLDAKEQNEGKLKWFDLNKINKEKIIHTDLKIIQEIIINKNHGYYNAIQEKKDRDYILTKFNKL